MTARGERRAMIETTPADAERAGPTRRGVVGVGYFSHFSTLKKDGDV
jgi:hypothetical protein